MTASADPPPTAAVRDELEGAVAGRIDSISPIERGKNAVYEVRIRRARGDASESAVLKVGTRSGEWLAVEPALLSRVAERTSVPVPRVLADGADAVDAAGGGPADDGGVDGSDGSTPGHPWYLMSAERGAVYARRPADLEPATVERVCREAGRHLGELHAAFPFDADAVGRVRRRGDELAVPDPFDDWPTLVREWIERNAARLEDTRFARDADAIVDTAPAVATDLERLGPFDPVLLRGDYRLANLLLAPDERPVTRAVLDWEAPLAGHAEFELEGTAFLLAGWPEFDDDRRRELRTAIYEGYGETNERPRGPEFRERRELYRFATRVHGMAVASEAMADRPAAVADAHAERLREIVGRRADLEGA